MYDNNSTGTEWVEGFFLLAGALWVIGALFVGTMVFLGTASHGDGSISPASNQTPVADSDLVR